MQATTAARPVAETIFEPQGLYRQQLSVREGRKNMKSQAIVLFFAASLALSAAAWGQTGNRSYQAAGNQLYAQSSGGYQTVAYDKDDQYRRNVDNRQDQREWKALLEQQKDERQACRNNRDRDDRNRCRDLGRRQKEERENFKNRDRHEDRGGDRH
jgi:hypothetical protein